MFAAAHKGEAGSAVSFQQHPAMLQPKPWWHLTVRAEWWGEEMSVMKLRNGAQVSAGASPLQGTARGKGLCGVFPFPLGSGDLVLILTP